MKNIISFILSIYTSLSFCNELQLSDRFERGVRGDFKHDNKSEKGGELGSQLLDFVVKLFVVELWIEQADPIGSCVPRVS